MTPEELLDVASKALRAYHFGGRSSADAADDIAFAANNYELAIQLKDELKAARLETAQDHSERAEEVAANSETLYKGTWLAATEE